MCDHDDPIEVRTSTGTVAIPSERVFFTFASGRFRYDCVTCGAQCCRGHGYNLQPGREVYSQLEYRPHMRFFMHSEAGTGTPGVRNFPPSCFFLSAQGRCTIHEEHGYDAKPETCRLFPFNMFRFVGNYLVVAPHPALCPLEILPSDQISSDSGYAELVNGMRAQGISSAIEHGHSIIPDVEQLVVLERRIIQMSEEHLARRASFTDFVDSQVAATTALLGDLLPHEARDGRGESGGGRCVLEAVCDVLGLERAEMFEADPMVDQALVAMTPWLRSQLVFDSPIFNFRTSGQHRQSQRWLGIRNIPYAVLAVFALAKLARHAGMPSITFQTVSRLFRDYVAVVVLLAQLADVVMWRRNCSFGISMRKEFPRYQRSYIELTKALLPRRQQRAKRRLADVLCELNAADGIERMAYLRIVSRRLLGRVVPVGGGEGATILSLRAPGPTLRRGCLDVLPTSFIEKACQVSQVLKRA